MVKCLLYCKLQHLRKITAIHESVHLCWPHSDGQFYRNIFYKYTTILEIGISPN